jgi:hypothetical protein
MTYSEYKKTFKLRTFGKLLTLITGLMDKHYAA